MRLLASPPNATPAAAASAGPAASVVALGVAVLAGPVTFLLHHHAQYLLVPRTCVHGTEWMLHLAAAVAALGPLVGAALAWRYRRHYAHEVAGRAGTRSPSRLIALAALLTSAICFLFIVWQWIPTLMLHPCPGAG